MSVNGVNATQTDGVYGGYGSYGSCGKEMAEANAAQAGADNAAAGQGVVYEKESASEQKAAYSVNQMSPQDRAALVEQLKADQEAQQQKLVSIVQKMLSGQAKTYGNAVGDSLWSNLAGGNFTVDAATRAQAQNDIAEDGYWGVKQTSQRLYDFACALAGDDVEKMKEMQAAMEKGFQKAAKTWGGELPGICQDTINAANQLFEDYYANH